MTQHWYPLVFSVPPPILRLRLYSVLFFLLPSVLGWQQRTVQGTALRAHFQAQRRLEAQAVAAHDNHGEIAGLGSGRNRQEAAATCLDSWTGRACAIACLPSSLIGSPSQEC